MHIDFAAILVALAAFTGIVWLIDRLLFAKARGRRAAEAEQRAVGTPEDKQRAAAAAAKEPLIVEYSRSFFPVILIVLLIRSFLAEPFRIPSASMMPTLLEGDFILVNKFSYGIRLPVLDTKIIEVGEPQRGDVVVFRYPKNPAEDYIKRVIGVPGDTITYREKQVYVNGVEVEQERLGRYIGLGSARDMDGADLRREVLPGSEDNPSVEHEILVRPQAFYQRDSEGNFQVPEGHYFVLGDNRDNSGDSRLWGFVPEENLVGKAFLIWLNFDTRNQPLPVNFSRIGTVIR